MSLDSNMNHKPDISKANECPPLPLGASMLDKVVYWLGIGLGSGLRKTHQGPGTLGGLIDSCAFTALGFYFLLGY